MDKHNSTDTSATAQRAVASGPLVRLALLPVAAVTEMLLMAAGIASLLLPWRATSAHIVSAVDSLPNTGWYFSRGPNVAGQPRDTTP